MATVWYVAAAVAKGTLGENAPMKKTKETFAGLMRAFGYRHDLRAVFDDFLTMALCAFSIDPSTGKSHDEELYLETIGKYARKEDTDAFPKLLALLVLEMEEQQGSDTGNDVLGTFYEQHLYRKGASQYFTPYPVCSFMAAAGFTPEGRDGPPQNILDPCCGSGRMLLATAERGGRHHGLYGIDLDPVCVRMAAANLFLNGIFSAEVMCADALNPDSFRFSYRTSFLPFGVFRVTEREKSKLWHMHRDSFGKARGKPSGAMPWHGPQLKMF